MPSHERSAGSPGRGPDASPASVVGNERQRLDRHADCAVDGIYVLRIEDALVVKRLAIHPFDRRITIQSDNPAYPDWPDRRSEEIDVVGRVLWAGRRLD